ncbi:MAG: hypothetical protein MZU95_09515 [Desulfomicrobium escambiense]|nr:hypothetical protein [Desulfomicrobium escambiense]
MARGLRLALAGLAGRGEWQAVQSFFTQGGVDHAPLTSTSAWQLAAPLGRGAGAGGAAAPSRSDGRRGGAASARIREGGLRGRGGRPGRGPGSDSCLGRARPGAGRWARPSAEGRGGEDRCGGEAGGERTMPLVAGISDERTGSCAPSQACRVGDVARVPAICTGSP